MYYSLPFIGHNNHPVGIFTVDGVVVGGVENALLGVALLGGDGGADRIAHGMQRLRGPAEKLAVTVPVIGIDIFNVEIHPVIGLLPQNGQHIFKDPVLYLLVSEYRMGDVPGKAAALAQIGNGQQGSHRICPGGFHHGAVGDGDQLPGSGHVIAEGTQVAEIGQGLLQNALGDVGVGVAVYLNGGAVGLIGRGH